MKNLYSEIRDDLKHIADTLEENGIEYSVYNSGVQYNAKDLDGIIHSFYPTTGTIIFHRSSKKFDRTTKVIRNSDVDTFISYLASPEMIKNLFKGE